ncbi:MAG TPA: hypothetical protein VN851_16395 [Thermoanaerobaculia bacterium]|nr:hypothetical protein [Thermoanaerobaculia bacterium]
MLRKLIFAAGLSLVLASAAGAQTWTAVASGTNIDEFDTGNYAISGGALFFRSGATGNVRGEINITNPKDSGNPSWTTFELVANGGAGGLGVGATATLTRQVRTTGATTAICVAVAPSTGVTSTTTCTFSASTFDFANNNYFVSMSLGRTATSQGITAYSVRVF